MASASVLRPVVVQQPQACVSRYIYVKQHNPGHDDSRPGFARNALFVAGLPAGADEHWLRSCFHSFGGIEEVALHPRKTSAVVVFSNAKGLAAVLDAAKRGKQLTGPEHWKPAHSESEGLRGLVEAHKAGYPGNAALQHDVDEWMANYEAEEEARKKAIAEKVDDGWTVVTGKSGRKRHQGATVSGGVSLAAAQEYAARKKPKVINDFYRFQAREQKKNELVNLRNRFEDAQKHLREMRAARKFNG